MFIAADGEVEKRKKRLKASLEDCIRDEKMESK